MITLLVIISAITLILSLIISFKEHSRGLRDFTSHLQIEQMAQQTQKFDNRLQQLEDNLKQISHQTKIEFSQMTEHLTKSQYDNQINTLKQIQDSLQKSMLDVRAQLRETLNHQADSLGKRVDKLTQTTEQKLKEISGQVEKRLTEGFEKTNQTFNDIIKRLALIDQAQQKITELSTNVVSLQEILADKRSRGAFGEVQLTSLIRNVMPENNFALQYTLSNGKRADCILFLPEPTGNVVIDAKFPLESYQRMIDRNIGDSDRRIAEQQFRLDIRKHIQDIASKYIIADETSDGAVMFIPAEAVFAEIHAHYPALVEEAQRAKVWLVSPTTMMAILTTSRAVLKDAATRKQVHIIQEHLSTLAKDFGRFGKRMDNLARHIQLAHSDVDEVHMSAKKIASRFEKIEKVELQEKEAVSLQAEETVALTEET